MAIPPVQLRSAGETFPDKTIRNQQLTKLCTSFHEWHKYRITIRHDSSSGLAMFISESVMAGGTLDKVCDQIKGLAALINVLDVTCLIN
jgi:hypothetical protein